ncbi:MAG: hypothetical protein ABSH56_01065 [Bryobacteraceae bacterium]
MSDQPGIAAASTDLSPPSAAWKPNSSRPSPTAAGASTEPSPSKAYSSPSGVGQSTRASAGHPEIDVALAQALSRYLNV